MHFPHDAEGRKAAAAAMTKAAPAFMAKIAALRKQFPGSKLTHFKAGSLEYGRPSKPGFQITEGIDHKAMQREREAQIESEKKRLQKAKSRRAR